MEPYNRAMRQPAADRHVSTGIGRGGEKRVESARGRQFRRSLVLRLVVAWGWARWTANRLGTALARIEPYCFRLFE